MPELRLTPDGRLTGGQFQRCADFLRNSVLYEVRKQAERTGRRDLYEEYIVVKQDFVKFLVGRFYEDAQKLAARLPH